MSTELAAPRRFVAAPPDGLVAAVLLSFLATAGLFYVNIMAALVSGLIDGLHFSAKEAGFVASANVYGAAFGALISVFLVKRIPWRRAALVALAGLIALDVLSMAVASAEVMIPLRFVHGTVGGFLVGVAFSVIARTRAPDRTFGMLLVVQFGLGGVGVMFLPGLVPIYGPQVLFLALVAFSAVTLLMLPFLADYPVRAPVAGDGAVKGRVRWGPLAVALGAIFLFQAGNMALAAYMIEIGRGFKLELDFVSTTLGIAAWIGALGSVLVVALGTRFGRFKLLLLAMVLGVAGNALFFFSASPVVFAAANIGTAVLWAFTIPYLLGLAAAFDRTGQTAAMGGFFSKMGLATGPLVGGLVLAGGEPQQLIGIAVLALAGSCAALFPAALLDRKP